jgi:hypothetical protein
MRTLRPTIQPNSPSACRNAAFPTRYSGLSKHANAAHPLALLRARRERARRYAAEQRDELTTFQLIELHSVPDNRDRTPAVLAACLTVLRSLPNMGSGETT